MKLKDSWKESYDQPREHIQKQRHYFANKGPSSQGYGFSSSHIWMWELDYKESWAPKNWCFWTVVLEKTLESPLDCKEIQPVHPKGDQSWVFTGRSDAEVETPILWPPHAKSWLIGKDPDGRDWGQEEKAMTEDEMAGSHHQLDSHEFGELWKLLMDREAWRAAIHGVAKSRTQLRNWTELNGLVVFFTLSNLSLNLAIRNSWSELQSAPSLVFAVYIEFLHLCCKEYNQSDFSVEHLVMSMCRVFSCVVWRGCLLWPVRSLV